MKGLRFACLCICFAVLAGCGVRESTPSPAAVSAQPSGTPSVSSAPPVSPASNQQAKKLVFSEDDNTTAIFHIGMTGEQIKQALTDNQLQIKPDYFGNSGDYLISNLRSFQTRDNIYVDFGTLTDLLNRVTIFPLSEAELSSPYCTQKGLRLGDTVDTVIKLYGEPLRKVDFGINIPGGVNDLGVAYYYDLPNNLDEYYAELENSQIPSLKDSRGAYLRVNISLVEGANFNKVNSIVYGDKANP